MVGDSLEVNSGQMRQTRSGFLSARSPIACTLAHFEHTANIFSVYRMIGVLLCHHTHVFFLEGALLSRSPYWWWHTLSALLPLEKINSPLSVAWCAGRSYSCSLFPESIPILRILQIIYWLLVWWCDFTTFWPYPKKPLKWNFLEKVTSSSRYTCLEKKEK